VTARARFLAVALPVLLASPAYAVNQPPHDPANNVQCVQCHIPYGGANATSEATGTTTAGSTATSLVDATKAWTPGAWTGGVVTFTSGANHGSYRTITGNTTTALSWTEALSAPVAAGDTYQIGKTTYDDIENKCRACHSATGTASTMPDVGLHVVNGGTTVIGCGKCHEPHGVEANTGRGNGMLRLSIRWPTATAQLAYPASPGNRLIAAGPPWNGICQICHTQTKYHRNDGTGADHFPTLDCTSCHQHQGRFEHGGGASGGTGCADCHGHDQGTDLGGGKTSPGAGTFQSHSTHTEKDADDRRGPNVTCAECHDTNAFPFFASGTDLNGDGKITLDETDACESCHSSSGTYDGVNDPAFGAKPNWQAGIYAADNASLKPGKDRWCAGCHDESPAWIGYVNAPWVAGEEGVATAWGTTGYGFYKTGHGLPSSQVYPWTQKAGSVQQRSGAGLACENCHDTTADHIDGVPRSYTNNRSGVGYQTGYRLKSVGGGVPMQMPRVYLSGDPTVKPEDFPLCFGCHNARPFTSASSTAATNFRDDTSLRNDHNYHLARTELVFRSDWASDDSLASSPDSRPTCVTCHNVHGSTQPAMINDGLLIPSNRGMHLSYASVAAGTPPVGLSLADSTATGWHEGETQYSASNPSGLCVQTCHNNADPTAWRFYARAPYDVVGPQIAAALGNAGSATVSVRFSKPVYGPSGGALAPSDLTLADGSGRTITAVDHVAGGTIAILTLSAALDGGLGVDTIAPSTSGGAFDHAGIYDVLGNRLPQTPATIVAGDATPPVVTIGSPASGATGVAVNAGIGFVVADAESGVVWSSVSLSLTGSSGYSAGYTAAQLTHSGSPASYTVSLVPDAGFGYGEIITVTVAAHDAMGNALVAPAWSFTTTVTATPVTVRLHPSGLGSSNGGWTTSPLNQWASVLDSNDDGTSYAWGSVANTTFYVNLDDPPSFSHAVQSVSVTAVIRISAGTGTFPFTLGWRIGAAGATQSASVSVADTDGWAVRTVALDGLGLTYSDIQNLQAFVTRSTSGTHTDQVTELYADVTYLP
jgi:hypothetical protein